MPLVFAGLEQAIGDLLSARFLRRTRSRGSASFPPFAHTDPAFFNMLGTLRFEGDVWAIPEGTSRFSRARRCCAVTAPLLQAQWVETFCLPRFPTPRWWRRRRVRTVTAAEGRTLVDYGARRGHGPHSGLLAARAAYIAGFHGTSHVEAARLLKIPASGTMAHSWVQSFDSETEAFAAYARATRAPRHFLLTPTTRSKVRRKAAAIDPPVQAVRIDSGDLESLSREVRQILDERSGREREDPGLRGPRRIPDRPLARRFVADRWVRCGHRADQPRATPRRSSMVYKLVEIDGEGKIKRSPGKKTYPMAKQVDRRRDAQGIFHGDVVMGSDETAEGEPLLVPIVHAGRLVNDLPSIEMIRTRCASQLDALPERLKDLDAAPDYPISYSDLLEADARKAHGAGGSNAYRRVLASICPVANLNVIVSIIQFSSGVRTFRRPSLTLSSLIEPLDDNPA